MSSSSSSSVSLTRPVEFTVKARSFDTRLIELTPNDEYHYDWEVTTDYDISFSFKFTERNSSSSAVSQPPTKSTRSSGQFLAPNFGQLELKFDNSHSKLRGKSIRLRERIENEISPKLTLGTRWLTPYGPADVEIHRPENNIYIVRLPYGRGYFTGATIKKLNKTELEYRNTNERCFIGLKLFFNNEIIEAENFFKSDHEKSPIFSLCFSALSFLKALLSWEKSDILDAMNKLDQTRELAQSFINQYSSANSANNNSTGSSTNNSSSNSSSTSSSMVSSFKNFVKGNSSSLAMSPAELESTIILSETYLLQSTLQFTDESYFSYVKAGLKIRSAWKSYEKCEKQLELPEYKDADTILDRSTRGGLKFGIGTFNAMISVLPAIILRIVSALGFPSDRFLGLNSLKLASELGGIRSPLAQLSILFYNCIIPQFFTVRPEYHIKISESVLSDAFQQYNSALFHWMNGRLQRMKRDLIAAERAFLTAAAVGPWKQLHHICYYELGFVYYFQLNYSKSIELFNKLELENSWSPGTFIYMQAAAHWELNTDEGEKMARKCLERIDNHLKRNFGGKKLSIEAFIGYRTNQFLLNGHRSVLAALEITYLFYGFIQMNNELLEIALLRVQERLNYPSTLHGDSRYICLLIQIGILKSLKRRNEAIEILNELEKCEELGKISSNEKHIIPFSRFELAAMKMEELAEQMKLSQNQYVPPTTMEIENIRILLKKSENYKGDYYFKNRLHFRIHLATVELKLMAEQWNESNVKGISSVTVSGENNNNNNNNSGNNNKNHHPSISGIGMGIGAEANIIHDENNQLTEEEMKQLEKEVAEEGLLP